MHETSDGNLQGCSFDVYCFGMTLLEITTGKVPYSECGTLSLYKKILSNNKPQNLDYLLNT